MKIVFFTKEKTKVDDIVKKDDLISRQSLLWRSADSLGINDKEGYFLLIEGSEEAIEKAKNLLKDLAEVVKDDEEIIKKIKEDEEKAMVGFGNILG
ncbi:MAG: hypothetical protein J7L43_02235 [Candidatus Aenigmarchaeota archaeon]|nr:hypothetical protein [Candidatus Aenigmarchaeota archaeon]